MEKSKEISENWKEEFEQWLKDNQKVLDPRAYLIAKHAERYFVNPLQEYASQLTGRIKELEGACRWLDKQLSESNLIFKNHNFNPN